MNVCHNEYIEMGSTTKQSNGPKSHELRLDESDNKDVNILSISSEQIDLA